MTPRMEEASIQVPEAWERIDISGLRGVVMIVGATDVGKSTFARYLYRRLRAGHVRASYLDGDPGQSTLGPPSIMTLAVQSREEDDSFPPAGPFPRSFVGSTSPAGHMLQMLTGAARLVRAGFKAGAEAIVFDTTGLIDPDRGGVNLKLAKIDLLRPKILFAIQREKELEPLLGPLRRSRRIRIVDLCPSPAVRTRDMAARQENRSAMFSRYFAQAGTLRIRWPGFAVFPGPYFRRNRLVAMEDVNGFTMGLAIVQSADLESGEVALLTPLDGIHGMDALRLGDLTVDPASFQDEHLDRWS